MSLEPPSLPTDSERRALHRRLRGWYRRARRALPWRETRDPYRIWVSEVMLQQTRVATAIPYYERFLERFPDVRALARARSEDVLAAWAGLGYYRRARHLHDAARLVVREHGGRIPADRAGFGRLPGVGRYTAGAVLSIAFDQPLPVLDGNVERVLARWFALRVRAKHPADTRRLWRIAETLVPMRHPGDWNQALMELGATICLPRAPRCGDCPVAALCRARASGRPDAYPRPAARRAGVKIRRAVAWVERGGRTLVTRREGALLAGLWEPPGVELPARASAGAALRAQLRVLGIAPRLADSGRRLRHTITHRTYEVEVWRGSLAAPRRADPAPARPGRATQRWVDPRRAGVALTALARKVLRGE